MIPALEAGFFRREIADAAFAYQRDLDAKRKLLVGVNAFTQKDARPLETMVIDASPEREQLGRLRAVKAKRDNESARRCLDTIRREAATDKNLMPAFLEAARARCTVGEIMAAMADVFGRYDGAARW